VFETLHGRDLDSIDGHFENTERRFSGQADLDFLGDDKTPIYELILTQIKHLISEFAPETFTVANIKLPVCVTELEQEIVKLNQCNKMYNEFFKYIQNEMTGPESELSKLLVLTHQRSYQ
jgi:hypothetical protein